MEQMSVLVLMDSNRKFVDFDAMFPNASVSVVPCRDVIAGREAVLSAKHADVVLIHLGTNDLNAYSPQEFVEQLGHLVSLIANSLSSDIFVSEVLPRSDNRSNEVAVTNEILRSVVPHANLISHNDITVDYLYDKVHLRFGSLHNQRRSGVEILARDLYRAVYDEECPVGIKLSRYPRYTNAGK